MEGRNDFLRGESSGVAYGGARLAAERERRKERSAGGVIALGATVEFSRSRTARVPRQGYVLARIRERASESTRFCFVNVNERGVHNYRGNGGADPRLSISVETCRNHFTVLFPLFRSSRIRRATRSFRDILLRVARSSSPAPSTLPSLVNQNRKIDF